MQFITQSEMDNLATMANQCLLPIVNQNVLNYDAGFPIWTGANKYFTKYAGGIYPFVVTPVFPQPSYSFVRPVFSNLVPINSNYDAGGNFSITITESATYIFKLGANDTKMHDPTTTLENSFGFDYDYSTTNFYLVAGTTVTLSGTPNASITAELTKSPFGFLSEMNRIRGDAMALLVNQIPGGEKLYQNTDAICSGPWIVGLIDSVAYPAASQFTSPAGEFVFSGVLMADFQLKIPTFKNVNFIFKDSDLPGDFSGNCGAVIQPTRLSANGDGGGATEPLTNTFNITANHAGTWNSKIYIKFSGSLPRPDASDFTISMTPDYGWTWTTITDSLGQFWLVGDLSEYALPAGTASIDMSITAPSGYGMETDVITGAAYYVYWIFSDLIFDSANTLVDVDAILTNSSAKSLSIPDVPANSVFTIEASGFLGDVILTGQFRFKISSQINGVWSAMTFPVPGINTFCDQDFPPYIGNTFIMEDELSNPISVGVAGNGQMDRSNIAPFATTMRQASPIQLGMPDTTLINGVQSILPGISCRPAKWLVRRDTDFVPFDFGFNTNLSHETISGSASASGSLQFYNKSVPADATGIKIRLVKRGTVPGWKNGIFQYGDSLPSNLTIYIKESAPPSPVSFDFKTTNNEVTIPPDGGPGYLDGLLNGGFWIGIQSTDGTDVDYDLYFEIDTGTPKRVYTPAIGECYSYVIDGTPSPFFAYFANGYGGSSAKPIPQNGYCIFQIRATRLPVLNNAGKSVIPQGGDIVTVTLGQNIFNDDGTITFTEFGDLTITIPADAGTSGDVKVFIPVLEGNELVYQCSQQVSLEAWVNWQPIFFSSIYGLGQYPFTPDVSGLIPQTSVYQYALGFVNDFNVTRPGWISPYKQGASGNPDFDNTASLVSFPLLRELYDDTVKLLILLGGYLPGGQEATGAGGTGSAGGAGNAGDPDSGSGSPDGL